MSLPYACCRGVARRRRRRCRAGASTRQRPVPAGFPDAPCGAGADRRCAVWLEARGGAPVRPRTRRPSHHDSPDRARARARDGAGLPCARARGSRPRWTLVLHGRAHGCYARQSRAVGTRAYGTLPERHELPKLRGRGAVRARLSDVEGLGIRSPCTSRAGDKVITSKHHCAVGMNENGRDLVVGDVHGCFRTLDHALSEFGFDPSRDRLFGVGDLVNRGPHSEGRADLA